MRWKSASRRERRAAPRFRRQWRIEIKTGAGVWRGTSVDVSTLGMRVRVDKPIEPRRLMFVSLEADGAGGVIWSPVSLVREVSSAEYGIRFVDLSERELARLTRLLAL
jgi:hypothetical protein